MSYLRLAAKSVAHAALARCMLGSMSVAVVARWSLVAIGLAVAVSVEGCGVGPGESVGASSEAVSFTNDKAAVDYFLGKGLANFQAAGIVGNLDQESGVDPLAVQSGGPGRGIAQ